MLGSDRYFLEVWFRGDDAVPFREKTDESGREPHPHITFVRPFIIPKGREELVKQKIIDYCSNHKPIKFILEGKGSFGKVEFVPVKSKKLQQFDAGIEKLLEGDVEFDRKLSDKKILHLTLSRKIDSFPRTESVMLRLICLRNKLIWFSFDFVTHKILSRTESKDEKKWKETLKLYQSKNSSAVSPKSL